MTFNAFAIPQEMRNYPNWIVWRLEWPNGPNEKPTKVPYQINGYKASVNEPSHWTSFEGAFNAYSAGGYDGIGFMFSNSPYSGVDLDDSQGDQAIIDRQLKIFEGLDSYSELSPSGTGLHIIVKGCVSSGRRRDKVELYSTGRFFTMTGNVYAAKPIAERQDILTMIWEQMGGNTVMPSNVVDRPQVYTDEQIIQMALDAVNGEKFSFLHKGDISQYQSRSEADQSYIDIIGFYSRNKEQIQRIFLNSPLGKFDKKRSRKDYLERTIAKSFDNMPAQIDIEGYQNALADMRARENEQRNNTNLHNNANSNSSTNSLVSGEVNGNTNNNASNSSNASNNLSHGKINKFSLPPGLVGEIAQFIYSAAPRPVEEYALGGAIALMSGICGRAYNVSNQGVNQYVLMIGGTGTGKEQAASGISKLINAVKMQVPTAGEFIGPSEISSGPALFKNIANQKSFLSILGEFGLRLKQLSSENANGADISLRRMLLDLYHKSGKDGVAYKSVYSDRDKNTTDIESPALSIFGESTPERLYGALSEEMISEGLLPRFHIIEYYGLRKDLNPHHSSAQPSASLITKMADVTAHCMTLNNAQPRRVQNVEVSPAAEVILDKFDRYATDQINAPNKGVLKELWNRAHIKALRLSAVIAIGCNYTFPQITEEHALWAINLITSDIDNLAKRFEAGEIGTNTNELQQMKDLQRVVKEYYKDGVERALKYGVKHEIYSKGVIPYIYLHRRLAPTTAFKNDKMAGTFALKRCIQSYVDGGLLRELDRREMKEMGIANQRLFILNSFDID